MVGEYLRRLLPYLLLGLFAYLASFNARDPRTWQLLKGLRVRHFLLGWAALAGVLVASALLLTPETILRWGWWSAIGGVGNVSLGLTRDSSRSLTGTILPLAIGTLFLFSLCNGAYIEEQAFRKGDEQRCLTSRIRRSVAFGLEHLLMGIPIGMGLALSVSGFALSLIYRRKWRKTHSTVVSLREATRVHIACNLSIVAIAFGILVHSLITILR